MKVPSAILAVLALGCFAFASLGGPSIPSLRYRGVVSSRTAGNSLTHLGTFVVPDKPANDGTWEQFGVSYNLQWSAGGEVHNDGKPLDASPQGQASTLGFLFFDTTSGFQAMPGHFVCAAPMSWPALDTGASHTKPLGAGAHEGAWWFGQNQFPYGGWCGVWPGQVLDVYAFNFPAWDDWAGWQNDPGGDHFYRATWSLDYAMGFEWQQQAQ